jgi:hypothetical protein
MVVYTINNSCVISLCLAGDVRTTMVDGNGWGADCPKVCYGRCSNNWKNEMCNDKCNVCCKRCNCVPPGTGQDTRHICPCYDTMINPHNGKLKCP